jgi:hypothetical protein
MSYEDLTTIGTDTLITWLANAMKTSAGALGHGKSERNEFAATQYRKELTRRKCNIPTDEELYEEGQFNGKGSW